MCQLRLFEKHKTDSEFDEPNELNSASLIKPDSFPKNTVLIYNLNKFISRVDIQLSDAGSPACMSTTSQSTHEESSSITRSEVNDSLQVITYHYPA